MSVVHIGLGNASASSCGHWKDVNAAQIRKKKVSLSLITMLTQYFSLAILWFSLGWALSAVALMKRVVFSSTYGQGRCKFTLTRHLCCGRYLNNGATTL